MAKQWSCLFVQSLEGSKVRRLVAKQRGDRKAMVATVDIEAARMVRSFVGSLVRLIVRKMIAKQGAARIVKVWQGSFICFLVTKRRRTLVQQTGKDGSFRKDGSFFKARGDCEAMVDIKVARMVSSDRSKDGREARCLFEARFGKDGCEAMCGKDSCEAMCGIGAIAKQWLQWWISKHQG